MAKSGPLYRATEKGLVTAVDSSGGLIQYLPDLTLADINKYATITMAANDFIKSISTANGQSIAALSLSPFDEDTKSQVLYDKVGVPIQQELQFEGSISQRVYPQYAVVDLVGYKEATSATINQNIASISQSGTTLSIIFATAWPELAIGDWLNISGLVDNRLNYSNLVVVTKTADNLTITATAASDIALPSLTVGPYNGVGIATYVPQIPDALNGYGYRFSGNSATLAAYLTKFGGRQTMQSGTFNGIQTATTGSTAPVFSGAATGQYDLKSTTRFYTNATPTDISFYDATVDGFTAYTSRVKRTASKPDWNKELNLRFRAVNPKSMPRPVAQIVSATKTASGTARIVTRANHGLVTGNYVTIHGINNQTAFANQATPVAVTFVDATTFDVTFGANTTATSYGGAVFLSNGGVNQPGLIGQTIQSLARDASNFVTVVGTATWSGVQIGEYYNLYGGANAASGADLGFDGVYECVSFTGTSLVLKPLIVDIFNNNINQNLAPNTGVVTTTNAGGVVILRTTLRIADIVLQGCPNQQQKVVPEGMGTLDPQKAAPVAVVNTPSVSISGTPNVNSTEVAVLAPSDYTLSSAATTNAASVKATAGSVLGLHLTNYGATAAYYKLYNKASAPTVGTDTPVASIMIPANTDKFVEWGRLGLRFSTGIASAITGAQAIADTTAVAANQVAVKMAYI